MDFEMDSRTVVKCHLELLKNKQHCDVAFIVGEAKERILSHRFPLVAHSLVLATMFAKRWKSTSDGIQEIEIPDVEPSIFRQFLKYLYGDKLTFEIENTPELYYVAHKYDVTELMNKCENLMRVKMENVTKDNIIRIYQVASLFDLSSLKEEAGDRITWEFSALLDHPSFELIDENTLLELLPRDLWVDELKLFEALLRWSYVKLGTETPSTLDQRSILKKLLPLIRFPSMSVQDFTLKVIPKGILTSEESTALLKYMESEEPARTDLRPNLGFPWQARPPQVSEYLVEFDKRKENDRKLTPKDFKLVALQVDVQKFSFMYSVPLRESGLNFTAFISSVILRGPNYPCWRMTQTWKVSLKVEKIVPDNDSSTKVGPAETCSSDDLERTIDNLEIFGNKNTVVDINPPFVVQDEDRYKISVSYCGSVKLPNPKTQDYLTSTQKPYYHLEVENDEGIAERGITIFAYYPNTNEYDRDRGHSQLSSKDTSSPLSDSDSSDDKDERESTISSHWIRSFKLKVHFY